MTVSDKSTDHRRLRFNSTEDCLKEMDRIVAAEKAGKLRRSGNWTAGQIFNHLASWINFGYEGFPMKVPWFIRMIIKRKVNQYINDGMPRGVQIPKTQGGTYATDDIPVEQAAQKLRTAMKRLGSEPPQYDSPAFGKLTQEQRIAMNLRHAELHMGYLHY